MVFGGVCWFSSVFWVCEVSWKRDEEVGTQKTAWKTKAVRGVVLDGR
jgi:hypothetical protein